MQMHVSVSQWAAREVMHAQGRCPAQAGRHTGGREDEDYSLLRARRKWRAHWASQPDMLGQCARGPCTVHPATDDAAQTAAASIYGLELPEMNNYVELCSAVKQKHISCM